MLGGSSCFTILAKNQAERQPVLNLQIAKAYTAGSDSGIATRTWQQAMEVLIATKPGAHQLRWMTAAKGKALKPLLSGNIIETQGGKRSWMFSETARFQRPRTVRDMKLKKGDAVFVMVKATEASIQKEGV